MNLESYIYETSFVGEATSPEDRTARISIITADFADGNFVEVGAGTGNTTLHLLNNAKIYKNKVLVIDPWQSDKQQPPGYGVYSYDDFKERTKGYDNLVVAHMP